VIPHSARNLKARRIVVATLAALMGAAAVPALAGGFDIPTGAAPSPLFGAAPFSQQMLMFEEFGTQPLPTNAPEHTLPSPNGCEGAVDPAAFGASLEAFLAQPLFPPPQEQANTAQPNAWASMISSCLGRPVTGVAEGRPPGVNFAHQRWAEFTPTVYFQSAMAGAQPRRVITEHVDAPADLGGRLNHAPHIGLHRDIGLHAAVGGLDIGGDHLRARFSN